MPSTFKAEYCFGGFPGEGSGVKTVPRLSHKPLPYIAGGPQLLLPGARVQEDGQTCPYFQQRLVSPTT